MVIMLTKHGRWNSPPYSSAFLRSIRNAHLHVSYVRPRLWRTFSSRNFIPPLFFFIVHFCIVRRIFDAQEKELLSFYIRYMKFRYRSVIDKQIFLTIFILFVNRFVFVRTRCKDEKSIRNTWNSENTRGCD